MPPETLILRFRDLSTNPGETIAHHRRKIEEHGCSTPSEEELSIINRRLNTAGEGLTTETRNSTITSSTVAASIRRPLLPDFRNSPTTGRPLPDRYWKTVFWVIRLLLAVIGGGLAVAYEIDKPLLAAHIGAATPIIIKAFSKGVSGEF